MKRVLRSQRGKLAARTPIRATRSAALVDDDWQLDGAHDALSGGVAENWHGPCLSLQLTAIELSASGSGSPPNLAARAVRKPQTGFSLGGPDKATKTPRRWVVIFATALRRAGPPMRRASSSRCPAPSQSARPAAPRPRPS
jgi:hypothetical protein